MTKRIDRSRPEGERRGAEQSRAYQAPRILVKEHLESAANVCLGPGLKGSTGADSGYPFPDDECGSTGLQS